MGVVGTKVVVMGTVRVELSRVAGGGLAKREWGFFAGLALANPKNNFHDLKIRHGKTPHLHLIRL
jgi:hypothetical protein